MMKRLENLLLGVIPHGNGVKNDRGRRQELDEDIESRGATRDRPVVTFVYRQAVLEPEQQSLMTEELLLDFYGHVGDVEDERADVGEVEREQRVEVENVDEIASQVPDDVCEGVPPRIGKFERPGNS